MANNSAPMSLQTLHRHTNPVPESEQASSRTSVASPRSSTSQHLTQVEIDKKPWKYIGYKGYSEFLASEDDFYVLRRFSAVSIRIALLLQDEATVLEDRLEELDREYSRRDAVDMHNGSFREDEEDRREVLNQLREKLLQYNAFVLQQAELKKFPSPLYHSPQNITNLENWHFNHDNSAITPSEQTYLTHKRDLFSVIPRSKSTLRRLLEKSPTLRIHRFWTDKKAPELPIYDKDVITYTSNEKVDSFITVVIVGIGMVMLIAPMWILEFLKEEVAKLGTITLFIVVFLGMISYASTAKPFEVLAATAAYAAVMMVFLQLGGSSSSTMGT